MEKKNFFKHHQNLTQEVHKHSSAYFSSYLSLATKKQQTLDFSGRGLNNDVHVGILALNGSTDSTIESSYS